MDLHALLERADAPHDLLAWAAAHAADHRAAWDAVERGDHRVWVAACGGVSIESLVEGAAAAVLVAIDAFSERVEPLAVAVELAVAAAEPDELVEAAEVCERLAAGGVGSYRGPAVPGFAAAARAAAFVARAAEGLAAGEAHREAARLEHARATSAYLGVGAQIVLPAAAGAPRLDPLAAPDPARDAFAFSVAACAEAIAESAQALAARSGDASPEATREAHRALDAVVRETIEESEGGAAG